MATTTIPGIPGTIVLAATDDFGEAGGATRGSNKFALSNYNHHVATTAAMTALDITGVANLACVLVSAATVVGQSWGIFMYDSASVLSPDAVTVFAPDSGSGRWIRVFAPDSAFDSQGSAGAAYTAAVAVSAQRASNLSDLANKATAKTNLSIREVNVCDYGADPTGVVDATGSVNQAKLACRPTGTIPGLYLTRYLGGYGTPSNTWTGRPSITVSGGLNGSGGFQAYGNVNTNGFLAAVEVSNIGSGYNSLAYTINRTNGSPVITLSSGSFDARIVAGVSVRHESLTYTCHVISRDSATQLTLSENMTFTNADQFIFGFPWVLLNGTPSQDFIIGLGARQKLKFPAGQYNLPNGIGDMGGFSNLIIDMEDADILISSVTGATGLPIRSCSCIEIIEPTFRFLGARYAVPAAAGRSMRYPGQMGVAIACSSLVFLKGAKIYDSFEFGIAIGGDQTGYLTQQIYISDCLVANPLGDGIHWLDGARDVRISRCEINFPGDDAFAGTGNWKRVVVEDGYINGGIYRGCVALDGEDAVFRNIHATGLHGPMCWAGPDGSFAAPTNVKFINCTGDNLGDTSFSTLDSNSGIGIVGYNMDSLTIRDCVFRQSPSVYGNAALLFVSAVTNLDWDAQEIESFGTTTTFTGSVNTDLNCQAGNGFAAVTLGAGRWKLEGTITARFAAGIPGTIWPVFFDGTTEYGSGSGFQSNDTALRSQVGCSCFVNVDPGSTKTVNFKLKQSGGGVQIDAGTVSGPNSYINAQRLS